MVQPRAIYAYPVPRRVHLVRSVAPGLTEIVGKV